MLLYHNHHWSIAHIGSATTYTVWLDSLWGSQSALIDWTDCRGRNQYGQFLMWWGIKKSLNLFVDIVSSLNTLFVDPVSLKMEAITADPLEPENVLA